MRGVFELLLGPKSHLNLAGKIVFFPFIVFVAIIWGLMDLLFTKREAP